MSRAAAQRRAAAADAIDARLAAIGGPKWFDPDGNVIGIRQADFLLAIPRSVAVTILHTSTGPIKISTVFLAMDHGSTLFERGGVPVLWETMVFGGPHSYRSWRWSDRVEAAAGHAIVVDGLRASLPDHDITISGSVDWPMAPVLRPAGPYLSLRERLVAAYGRRRLGRLRARYNRHKRMHLRRAYRGAQRG